MKFAPDAGAAPVTDALAVVAPDWESTLVPGLGTSAALSEAVTAVLVPSAFVSADG